MAHTAQLVVAGTLLGLAWAGSALSALIAYGVAEMYASNDSPFRSGMATGLEVGGLPLGLVMLLCLGAAVAAAAADHRVLLWLAIATVPVGFLVVALAGAGGALQSAG